MKEWRGFWWDVWGLQNYTTGSTPLKRHSFLSTGPAAQGSPPSKFSTTPPPGQALAGPKLLVVVILSGGIPSRAQRPRHRVAAFEIFYNPTTSWRGPGRPQITTCISPSKRHPFLSTIPRHRGHRLRNLRPSHLLERPSWAMPLKSANPFNDPEMKLDL